MSRKKITMIGVGESHYPSISEKSSRILTFPDGKARLLTLKNWYWEVLDKLHKEKGWPTTEIPAMAFQVADRHHPKHDAEFEECLRWGVSFLIKLNMGYIMREDMDWSIGNDDNL
jgi:hypothetical protein